MGNIPHRSCQTRKQPNSPDWVTLDHVHAVDGSGSGSGRRSWRPPRLILFCRFHEHVAAGGIAEASDCFAVAFGTPAALTAPRQSGRPLENKGEKESGEYSPLSISRCRNPPRGADPQEKAADGPPVPIRCQSSAFCSPLAYAKCLILLDLEGWPSGLRHRS